MKILGATIVAGLVLCGQPSALAQRDAGDRGLRLEHHELQNDATQRMRRTQPPPVLLPPPQPEEPAGAARKSKRSRPR